MQAIEEGRQTAFSWGTHDPIAWPLRVVDRLGHLPPFLMSTAANELAEYTDAPTMAAFLASRGWTTAADMATDLIGPPEPHNRRVTRGDPVFFLPNGGFGELWLSCGWDAFSVAAGVDGLRQGRTFELKRTPGARVFHLEYRTLRHKEMLELRQLGLIS